MTPKFLKLETQVLSLLEANIEVSTITTILKKTPKSITNTIQRIKRKKNIKTILKPTIISRPKLVLARTIRSINRDLSRSPKKKNKTILENNSLDLSTRSL